MDLKIIKYLLFQFKLFDLEDSYEGHCYDYVMVTDHESHGNTTAEKICSRHTGAALRNLSFVSDGNYMVVKFVSDEKIAGAGYSAIYYAFNEEAGRCIINFLYQNCLNVWFSRSLIV